MDDKVKRAWIKALRSGKYEQGIGHFRKHNKFCCLGVLSMIQTGKATPSITLCSSRYGWPDDEVTLSLARLNDSGATFEQIALCIENGL